MSASNSTILGSVLDTDGGVALCSIERDRLEAFRASGTDSGANASIGAIMRIEVLGTAIFGSLTGLRSAPDDHTRIVGELEYIGEGPLDAGGRLTTFRRGVTHYPQPGDPLSFASEADLATIFAPPDKPHIQVGTVFPTQDVRAPILFDMLMGRHFAVVGSSGAGKSTTVTLMLDRIVQRAQAGHVIIFDPHGEYSHAFGDLAQVWDVDNLKLPYWALNFDEHCDAFITGTADERTIDANIMAKVLLAARRRNISLMNPSKITADTPVAYQLADLTGALEEEAGKLEKIGDASRYTHLRLTIEQFFRDRRYDFIFNAEHADASLENLLGGLLRIPNQGKPVSIVDLAGVPTEIVNVVVATLARLILDYAIWAPRDTRAPVLLVCEEAHRYLPRFKSEATRSVEKQLERISREGRKYGVCLGMITQRPSELSETALSQCGTIMSLRLNNQNDQQHLMAALAEGARSFAGSVGTLKNRECIITGDGVPIPMRVMIDTLEEEKRPASDDPVFSERWTHDHATADLLERTVKRWQSER
ncbi:ATP-binding protein [Tsuneonella mangrovi]|uniref:ATP-binding protein n=1 Tax=Tsuneonella mangrovi TaxID=1982042 RepID=UPI000BA26295|nr:ATP-binding protein [Tsuneonella mangrovi]